MTNPFKNVRLNVMLSVAILSGVGGYFFVTTAYTPRREEVAAVLSHEARLVQLNKNNREILVAIGLDKIKEALLRYKEQASHVSALVPSDSAGVTRRSLLDVVTVSAANTGVRLVDSKPLSPGQQSGFATEGFTLTVVGRYHDVGALMTELLSMDRITQLQKIRLHAVPLNATDDLASQSASGAPGAGPTPSALPGTPGQSYSPIGAGAPGAPAPPSGASVAGPPAYGVEATFDLVGFVIQTAPPVVPGAPGASGGPGAVAGPGAGGPPRPGTPAAPSPGAPPKPVSATPATMTPSSAGADSDVIIPKKRPPRVP